MALTSWHDLLARLERQPDSDILAAMLTDELMEARGMARNEADKYVATARRAALDTLDMTWLANLLRSKGAAFDALVTAVQSALALYAHETITLFVVAGTDPPRIGEVPTDVPDGAIFHGFPVAIPASWARTWWTAAGRPAISPTRPDPARPGGQHGARRRPRIQKQ